MNFLKKYTKFILLLFMIVTLLTLTFIQFELIVEHPKLFWIRITQEIIFLIVFCSEFRSFEDSVYIGCGLVSLATTLMILVSRPELRINLLGI